MTGMCGYVDMLHVRAAEAHQSCSCVDVWVNSGRRCWVIVWNLSFRASGFHSSWAGFILTKRWLRLWFRLFNNQRTDQTIYCLHVLFVWAWMSSCWEAMIQIISHSNELRLCKLDFWRRARMTVQQQSTHFKWHCPGEDITTNNSLIYFSCQLVVQLEAKCKM